MSMSMPSPHYSRLHTTLQQLMNKVGEGKK
jgi:hypothetical protein